LLQSLRHFSIEARHVKRKIVFVFQSPGRQGQTKVQNRSHHEREFGRARANRQPYRHLHRATAEIQRQIRRTAKTRRFDRAQQGDPRATHKHREPDAKKKRARPLDRKY
jgi:hypothetical protein